MGKSVHYLKIFLLLLIFACGVNSWKKCAETFCGRVRSTPGGSAVKNYILKLETLKSHQTYVEGTLTKTENNVEKKLSLKLTALQDSTFQLVINEVTSKRYRDPKVLLQLQEVNVTLKTYQNKAEVTFDDVKGVIYSNPFKIEFWNQDTLVSIVNPNNRMVFGTTANMEDIALGVSFPEAIRAYGLPEHAERLSLQNTGPDGLDPYRHFNLDYGAYAVESPESLYGAVGVLYGHALTHSSGIFWFNTAQTWVDIETVPNKQVDAYFMSETGAIELFVLTGPTLATAVQQYAKLTGVAPLPQYFSLGYHQSRYSYMTQQEVVEVVNEFDNISLPVDVLWLDIDYTEKIKYFTWNEKSYPKPVQLQREMLDRHRVIVAIIDPHIKTESGYFLHDEAVKSNYYVRNPDGQNYVGECWPGLSSYLDFLKPNAFNYYASLYNTVDTFDAVNLHVWNDMNEPSVFNNPDHENTMAPDLLHHENVKHKAIHNIYGLYQIMATWQGMLNRTVVERPFILTRSHFAGAQRYAAIWTGDNLASWEHLKISFPMCLTEALAGISFCGADVGGFVNIPSDELYQRWYQAGAWLPFYRGHSEKTVPRREPYLFPKHIQQRVKVALNQRYAHIPEWYKAFREHELTGEPVIRPIIYQYPMEGDALDIDNHVLIGENILAAPILEEGIAVTTVYLPGGASQNWFNIDENFKMYNGLGFKVLPVTLNSVPVFYRGGSIIVRKDTPRLTTWNTKGDPYTLYICLNNDKAAEGTLYEDDHTTFDYMEEQESHIYISLTFVNNTLVSKKLTNGTYNDGADITKLVILNPPQNITSVRVGDKRGSLEYSEGSRTLSVSNLTLQLATPFQVQFTSFAIGLRFNFVLFILIVIKAIFL